VILPDAAQIAGASSLIAADMTTVASVLPEAVTVGASANAADMRG
jgi:hypothetical protein